VNAALVAKEGGHLLTTADLEWADVIFVMEEKHRQRINEHTECLFCDKIINLSIPDEYEFMNGQLIGEILQKVPQYL
jgi:predicted protein tyrosine phosphatase